MKKILTVILGMMLGVICQAEWKLMIVKGGPICSMVYDGGTIGVTFIDESDSEKVLFLDGAFIEEQPDNESGDWKIVGNRNGPVYFGVTNLNAKKALPPDSELFSDLLDELASYIEKSDSEGGSNFDCVERIYTWMKRRKVEQVAAGNLR